jgi:signal transduction histidine kinase
MNRRPVRQFVEDLYCPALIIDAEGKVVHANARAAALLAESSSGRTRALWQVINSTNAFAGLDNWFGGVALEDPQAKYLGVRAIRLSSPHGSHLVLLSEMPSFVEQAFLAGVTQESVFLGLDLHDRVLQDLSYIRLQLERLADRVQDSENDTLQEAVASLASVAQHLREKSVTLSQTNVTGNFADALNRLIATFEKRLEIPIDLRQTGQPRDLPANVRVQLLRILEEALNNVWKHACAQRVVVHLNLEHDRAELRVEDDGVGFDVEPSDGLHIGLKSMHRRATAVGGELHIDTAPGAGTKVIAHFTLTSPNLVGISGY